MKPQLLLLILITTSLLSCKQDFTNPIPEKHPDQALGKYDKYLGLLNKAYESNNKFDAAIQLANLKADPEITFQYLDASIKENPDNCEKIYEWYWLYDRNNFGVNLLKLDTSLYKQSVKICDQTNEQNSYVKYAVMKDEEEQHARDSKPKEDSTNYNLKLVKELEQINKTDQDVRIRLTAKNVTPEMEEKIRKEMHIVDSINMVKIDNIFEEYGYPSRDLVGKDCNFTPALVIHHSNSLADRKKYLPLLEKAVEDGILYEGTLNMIKRRMEDMKLDEIKIDL